MKVTVCELPDPSRGLEEAWGDLAGHVRARGSDLVLLPEMPFGRWLPADPEPDPGAWEEAVRAHRRWNGRLGELGAPAVAATRPVIRGGRRLNEAFVWTATEGARPAHAKHYLPDEEGFREATWYDRGPGRFEPAVLGRGGDDGRDGVRAGFLVCTELWFPERARSYGRAGIHLLLAPRATPGYSREKWLAAGRTAAVIAGAWGLSSNRSGPGPSDAFDWAGGGWVVGPDGDVAGVTSSAEPFLTVAIDPATAEAAKSTYPRYVEE